MKKGFPRFRQQAESLNVFDEIYMYDEKSLGKDFRKKWGRYLFPYARGYGYWAWKPYLLLDTMKKLEEGDLLLYVDLGCFFNIRGKQRLLEYFDMVEKNSVGIVGFRSQEEGYNNMPETLYYDYEWTKGDTFDYFGVRADRSYTHTTQFEATVILFKKSAQSVAFIEEWLKVLDDDESLITDSPSRTPNFEGFRENRHDQSIYSLLAKKYKIGEISTNEIFPVNQDWTLLESYPILAMRDKHYPSKFHYKHRFRLRKVYKMLWNIKYFFKDLF